MKKVNSSGHTHQNFCRRLCNGRQHVDALGGEIATEASPQTLAVAPAGINEVASISTYLLQHDQVALLKVQERLTIV